MFDSAFWSWGMLAVLGGFHGINPGMGWLFAVALGMQERSRAAVWHALLPLGLGHALAVGAVLIVATFTGTLLPAGAVRTAVALLLVAFGSSRLIRHRHPKWRGFRVGMGGLTLWSFLMASAHGAGLMLLPFVINRADHSHAHHASAADPMAAMLATGIHGAAYLVVTALAAWMVYEKLGVMLLRRAWVNLDFVWALVLVMTGAVTLFM